METTTLSPTPETPVRIDTRHPPTKPPYPAASIRAEEQGSVRLLLVVGPDGRVMEARVKRSSGFPRLDQAAERLRRGLVDRTHLARGNFQRIDSRLSLPLLSARLDRAQERLGGLARLHASLNPDAVLQRGYVRVTGPDGTTLTGRAAAAGQSSLTLHFRDGELKVVPGDGLTASASSRSRPAPKPVPPEQGKLL